MFMDDPFRRKSSTIISKGVGPWSMTEAMVERKSGVLRTLGNIAFPNEIMTFASINFIKS